MGCAHKENQDGFTLVEISIVMIIIGLLIGGTFGGMKLIENMQVNKTVQDLKAIESAALTFRDTYGRLPGDLRNPSSRLPNCTVAPCATTGDGDRVIDPPHATNDWGAPIDVSWERYTFWHHLQASDLLSLSMKNSLDPTFGEGQPSSSFGSGYRLSNYVGNPWVGFTGCSRLVSNSIIVPTDESSGNLHTYTLECRVLSSIDRKIDDGIPWNGRAIASDQGGSCASPEYIGDSGIFWFLTRF